MTTGTALDNPILNQARAQQATTQEQTATPKVASATSPDSLDAVKAALEANTARTVTSIQQLEDSVKQSTIASDVIVSSIQDITSAKTITQKAGDTANLQAQNNTIEAFNAAGGVSEQTRLLTTLKEDNSRVEELLNQRQDIIDDEHTGIQLIDNIVNNFRSSQLNLEIGAAQAQLAQTERAISNTAAATESVSRANALTKRTLNEGVIEANYNAITAEGEIKAAEAKLAALHSNAQMMLQLNQADSRNVTNLLQVYRLEGEEQERAVKVERLAFQREQMTQDREMWKTQLPKAKLDLERAQLALDNAKKAGPTQQATAELNLQAAAKRFNDIMFTEGTLVNAVQAGQSLAGTTVEDKETILWGLSQPGDTGERYRKLQEIGGSSEQVIGLTPFEAKKNLHAVAPSGNLAPTSGIGVLDQITTLQQAKYKKAGATVPKDEAQLATDFNTTAKEFFTLAANEIKAGDKSNPYQAPPMQSLIEAVPAVATTPLYNNVLKAMNLKEIDAQTILDAAMNGVRAKSISPEQAASGIETVFKSAALYNNTIHGGFRRLGLPNQTTYNVQLKRQPTAFEALGISASRQAKGVGLPDITSTLLGTGLGAIVGSFQDTLFTIDLMDATKVQEVIIKMMSTQKPAPAAKTNTEENP